jgi:hypothetical protein
MDVVRAPTGTQRSARGWPPFHAGPVSVAGGTPRAAHDIRIPMRESP